MFAGAQDTIFAQASAVGKAAVAVFRISGPACSNLLAALAPGASFPDRVAVLRTLMDPSTGAPIDRALVTRCEAPRSFTGAFRFRPGTPALATTV